MMLTVGGLGLSVTCDCYVVYVLFDVRTMDTGATSFAVKANEAPILHYVRAMILGATVVPGQGTTAPILHDVLCGATTLRCCCCCCRMIEPRL